MDIPPQIYKFYVRREDLSSLYTFMRQFDYKQIAISYHSDDKIVVIAKKRFK